MDCRRSVVLALALVGSAWGCSWNGKQSALPPLADATDDARPERTLPQRAPRAKTCLAMGELKEREADAPQRTALEREQMLEHARKSYQQALELEPRNLEAALALARLYTKRADHERAIAVYQKAARAHPKEPRTWSELGMCHARRREWEPAVKSLHKALELDPENRQAAHFLAYSLVCAGRPNEGFELFRKTDGEAMAHYNLARMLQQLNQSELSRQHAQLALQKDPRLLPAQQLLAQLETAPAAPNEYAPARYQDGIE